MTEQVAALTSEAFWQTCQQAIEASLAQFTYRLYTNSIKRDCPWTVPFYAQPFYLNPLSRPDFPGDGVALQ